MYCYHCMTKLEEGARQCSHCGQSTEVQVVPHHLRQGTILNNKYLVGDAIGEGGFGITYVGFDLNLELKIAIKEFYPNGYANRNNTLGNNVTLNYQHEGEYFKNGKEQFLREAQNIAKFSKEDGVVDVRDYFTENNTAYIIMEYLEGDTLAAYLKKHGRMEAQAVFQLMLPVMHALDKMHNTGIIHRDISPDNIMFTEDHSVRLMDFGSARYFTESEKKTMSVMLKPGYAPYEQYSSKGDQGPWTDVYGLCATMYKCITGNTPVDSLLRCKSDTLKKPSQMGVGISPALEAVLMYGLAVFPEQRCRSMKELIGYTERAFSSGNDIPPRMADDTIYRTAAADDIPTTSRPRRAYDYAPPRRDYPYSAPKNTYREPPREQPRKSYSGLIALFVTLTLIVIGAVVVFLLFGQQWFASGDSTSVSQSGDTVVVSDVSGKLLSDATSELEGKGLVVATRKELSDDVAEGYVIRQSVNAGRELNKGDTVLLYVASAPSGNDTDSASNEDNSNDAGNDTSDPPPAYASQGVLYNTLCKEYVTLRSSASMKASEITRIPKYAAVDLIAYVQDSDFMKVGYNGKIGYVMEAFFTAESTANGRYVKYCIARQQANLRSKPGSDNNNNIASIYTDSPVCCTGRSEDVNDQRYLEVIYRGQTGWVLDAVFSDTMDGHTYKGD
ncbi:protein kinase domain-containing protein [Ruminococcus difficilis]|uniref:non-specific serine/threonine protein kinase n=1 Tax=Ruminococcus difficilis TaxID=2763069 RepID=A0A934U482_9FIRM|nr:protein kinase [Ruminococcus difficilis]MBK6088299.1 serine/threonine protein kinase [Ruminococcus difficilis]